MSQVLASSRFWGLRCTLDVTSIILFNDLLELPSRESDPDVFPVLYLPRAWFKPLGPHDSCILCTYKTSTMCLLLESSVRSHCSQTPLDHGCRNFWVTGRWNTRKHFPGRWFFIRESPSFPFCAGTHLSNKFAFLGPSSFDGCALSSRYPSYFPSVDSFNCDDLFNRYSQYASTLNFNKTQNQTVFPSPFCSINLGKCSL